VALHPWLHSVAPPGLQGSIGIIGAVRTALFVAPAKVADSLRESNAPVPDRILAVSKTNLGRTPPSLGYRVNELPARLPMTE
jgi:hypothetical protein